MNKWDQISYSPELKCKQLSQQTNHYWTQYRVDYDNDVIDWTQTWNKCDIDIDYRYLQRLCKIECYYTKYWTQLTKVNHIPFKYILSGDTNHSMGRTSHTAIHYLDLTYCRVMDWINYISGIGGLLSMYAGLSANSIMLGLSEIVYKIIKYYLKNKYYKVFVKYIQLIFMAFMIKELFHLVNDYLVSNTKIDISLTEDIDIPVIYLATQYHASNGKLSEAFGRRYDHDPKLYRDTCKNNFTLFSKLMKWNEKYVDIYFENTFTKINYGDDTKLVGINSLCQLCFLIGPSKFIQLSG